jgi:hypothetical protein
MTGASSFPTEETVTLSISDGIEFVSYFFNVTIRLLPIFNPKIAPIFLQSGQTHNLNLIMESNNHTN